MSGHKVLVTTQFETLYEYAFDPASPPDKKTIIGVSKPSRICCFCGRSEKITSFKKIAHIIPEGLGNRYLLSNEECDDCNERSGATTDTDFISAMNPFRFNARIRGKDGRIKIRHPARKSFINTSTKEQSVEIEQHIEEEPLVSILNENTLDIKILVPAHRPIEVPKQLARLGFFISDELRRECDPIYKYWILGQTSILPVQYFHAFIPGPGLRLTKLQVLKCTDPDSDENCRILIVFSFANVILYFHLLKNTLTPVGVIPLPPIGKSPYPPHNVTPKLLKVMSDEKHKTRYDSFQMHYSSANELEIDPT